MSNLIIVTLTAFITLLIVGIPALVVFCSMRLRLLAHIDHLEDKLSTLRTVHSNKVLDLNGQIRKYKNWYQVLSVSKHADNTILNEFLHIDTDELGKRGAIWEISHQHIARLFNSYSITITRLEVPVVEPVNTMTS